jgi:hypothetical protein
MLMLAALDLGGAYAAKEAALRRSLPIAACGVVLFVLLFWVYASSLRYADLAPVTFGWIVILQVGVLVLDRFHYGTQVSRGQWAAVAVLLAAQTYLVLAPSMPVAVPTVAVPTVAVPQVGVPPAGVPPVAVPADRVAGVPVPVPRWPGRIGTYPSAEGRYSSRALR